MNEQSGRVDELVARVRETAAARNLACERFSRHQELSMWTLAYLALIMVLIPLVRAADIPVGIPAPHLFAAEAVLAVLVLVYAVLLGQEKFVSQGSNMKRSALELERLVHRIAAKQRVTDADYSAFTKEYFDILDKYDSHQPVDDLLTRLGNVPTEPKQWPPFLLRWAQAQLLRLCHYLHYIVTLAFTVFVTVTLYGGLIGHDRPTTLSLGPGDAFSASQTARKASDGSESPRPD